MKYFVRAKQTIFIYDFNRFAEIEKLKMKRVFVMNEN